MFRNLRSAHRAVNRSSTVASPARLPGLTAAPNAGGTYDMLIEPCQSWIRGTLSSHWCDANA